MSHYRLFAEVGAGSLTGSSVAPERHLVDWPTVTESANLEHGARGNRAAPLSYLSTSRHRGLGVGAWPQVVHVDALSNSQPARTPLAWMVTVLALDVRLKPNSGDNVEPILARRRDRARTAWRREWFSVSAGMAQHDS
jgi:hypothetical protein